MKKYCWNCEKITRQKAKKEKNSGGDNPTIMYLRIFECQECGEGYFNHWYFRNPKLRKNRRKKYVIR
jgi:hypothetical protein